MRLLATLSFFIVCATSHSAFAGARRIIRCQGEMTLANGQVDPTHEIVISTSSSGIWYLHLKNRIVYAGPSVSRDPSRVFIDQYHMFREDGVRIHYDSNHHRLSIKYKLYLGSLGGGSKRVSGIFENCEEFEDELPKRTTPACEKLLW